MQYACVNVEDRYIIIFSDIKLLADTQQSIDNL